MDFMPKIISFYPALREGGFPDSWFEDGDYLPPPWGIFIVKGRQSSIHSKIITTYYKKYKKCGDDNLGEITFGRRVIPVIPFPRRVSSQVTPRRLMHPVGFTHFKFRLKTKVRPKWNQTERNRAMSMKINWSSLRMCNVQLPEGTACLAASTRACTQVD